MTRCPICNRRGCQECCDCPEYGRCPKCGSIPIGELHDKLMRDCPPPWGSPDLALTERHSDPLLALADDLTRQQEARWSHLIEFADNIRKERE